MGPIRSVAETCFAEGLMHRKQSTELQSGLVWHGHISDLARLVYCLAAHCSCGRPTQMSDGEWRCSAHRMLDDQHTLDHLAFARDMRQHFLDSEWTVLSEHEEPRGTGQLDVDRRQTPRIPAQPRTARVFACALAALLLAFSLSGPLLSPDATSRPVAAWQAR
jgi:hypothetical protein